MKSAAEFDGEGLGAGLPLDCCAGTGGYCAKAFDVGRGCSGSGEGRLGEAGGMACGVAYFNVVSQQGDGVRNEVGRETVDGLRRTGTHGEARQRSADDG